MHRRRPRRPHDDPITTASDRKGAGVLARILRFVFWTDGSGVGLGHVSVFLFVWRMGWPGMACITFHLQSVALFSSQQQC